MKHPPVIIIKRKRHDAPTRHHATAWKVAYADFVTAMMAFFLVMWLVSQSTAVKQAVGGYFRDPGIFDDEYGRGVVSGEQASVEAQTPDALRQGRRPLDAGEARKALEDAASRLKRLLGRLPEFERLEKQIEIQLTAEGLRVELVDSDHATFFDSGSATLKRETERILATIASELGKLDSPVVVEGHTDSLPYSKSGWYTNWELSADRANAARRVMDASGLRKGQVRAVRGYADVHLRDAAHPTHAHNRRVSIVVQNAEFEAPAQASIAVGVAAAPPSSSGGARVARRP